MGYGLLFLYRTHHFLGKKSQKFNAKLSLQGHFLKSESDSV